MSYSVGTTARSADIGEAIDAIELEFDAGEHTEAMNEHIELGKKVAKDIIASGKLGDPEIWGVSIFGHANPGHEHLDGWADDALTIQVSQASPEQLRRYALAARHAAVAE